MYTKPKKQPYIKVRYKLDHSNAGIKKGDEVTIAYHHFNAVPPLLRQHLELVEGPETLEELKTNELASLQELHTKLGESLQEPEEETEGEEKKPKRKRKK